MIIPIRRGRDEAISAILEPLGRPITNRTARIYMAGPLGFSEAGRHFHASVLVPFISNLGFEVVDPWALTDPDAIAAARAMPHGRERREAWERLNRRSPR